MGLTDNLKPNDVFTVEMLNEIAKRVKMLPYMKPTSLQHQKPSEDGQEDDQAETKEGFKLWDRERTGEILTKHLVPAPDRD